LITLCEKCHDKIHKKGKSGEVKRKDGIIITGMGGFEDKIAQRTMQGKTLMYQELEKIVLLLSTITFGLGVESNKKIAPISLVYGYQTSSFRKSHSLPKEHFLDALCIATLETGEFVFPRRDRRFVTLCALESSMLLLIDALMSTTHKQADNQRFITNHNHDKASHFTKVKQESPRIHPVTNLDCI